MYKIPASSWMIPGGNRDKKRLLMTAQQYPMMSAIQNNLGGPLSEVFFSFLTPQQQDSIGYTPKLEGPGQDLWVSPSDILMNHVVMSPPYTIRLKQAMTHQSIMQLGQEVETKVHDQYAAEMEEAFRKREKILKSEYKMKENEAVMKDRQVLKEIRGKYLQQASTDLLNTLQKTLSETVSELLKESLQKLKEENDFKQQEMEKIVNQAVNDHSYILTEGFQFQLAYRENELCTEYEGRLRKLQDTFEKKLDEINAKCLNQIKAKDAEMAANHVTDLIVDATDRAMIHRREKVELEHNFEHWFRKYFVDEITKREFTILDRENEIRSLKAKCERREHQLQEVFKHFQRFINFALKEKPGQAEFMLSLKKELKEFPEVKPEERDVAYMARTIVELLVKTVAEKQQEIVCDLDKKEQPEMSLGDFCNKKKRKRLAQRLLKLEGEKNITTLSDNRFINIEKKSLVGMFEENTSMVSLLKSKKKFQEK